VWAEAGSGSFDSAATAASLRISAAGSDARKPLKITELGREVRKNRGGKNTLVTKKFPKREEEGFTMEAWRTWRRHPRVRNLITLTEGLLDKYPIKCALLRFSHAGETSIATGFVAPPIFATGHSVDPSVGTR
jgi:hypothetical protein